MSQSLPRGGVNKCFLLNDQILELIVDHGPSSCSVGLLKCKMVFYLNSINSEYYYFLKFFFWPFLAVLLIGQLKSVTGNRVREGE